MSKSSDTVRGAGQVYLRGSRWWVSYYVRGKRFRESAGTTEAEARRKLKSRLKEIHGARFVGPQEERITVDELIDSLVLHLRTKGAKSVASCESHLRPVREYFSLCRAIDVSTVHVERFIQERLELGKARATVNRETGALKQALNLARKQGRVNRIPYIPCLKEDNARQGFFERGEFEAVLSQLPDPVNGIALFAYLSGWRKGEILPLRWESVDRAAREVRLRTSKSGHGRVLPLDGESWELIEKRHQAREYRTDDGMTRLSPYIFHKRGRPISDFRKSWTRACTTAGVPGKLFHDLRRTAVRDMVRAGVPQSVAMSISGHRTVSIFQRYNITSGDDMRDALRRTHAYRSELSSDRKVIPLDTHSKRR